MASDASYSYANLWTVLPGYATLAFHAVTSIALEQTQSMFPSSVTRDATDGHSRQRTWVLPLAVPLYVFRTLWYVLATNPAFTLLTPLPVSLRTP